jgi:hypothetical protein
MQNGNGSNDGIPLLMTPHETNSTGIRRWSLAAMYNVFIENHTYTYIQCATTCSEIIVDE